MSDIIEINGKKYRPIPENKVPVNKPSSAAMALMFGMSGGSLIRRQPSKKNLRPIDVVKEYELILNKKSGYTKTQREKIIIFFKSQYEEITEPSETNT